MKQNGEYSVSYQTDNHFSVITQAYGSIWKDVFSYCVVNTAIYLLVWFLKEMQYVDLAITGKGHSISTLFVSFLIISRVNMSLSRYNESRTYLSRMYAEGRELIQNAAVFSMYDKSEEAKEWRNELAYNVCMLLRLTMAVIDYEDSKVAPWNVPELSAELKKDLSDDLNTWVGGQSARWTHGERGEREEGLRVPIRMSYVVRKSLYDGKDKLKDGLEQWQLGKMFGSVNSFMDAYYGQRKFLTTPFPFPLVQMARTFLFLWVYTLPLVLLSDSSSVPTHCVVIFFVTYGFLGLESVSIQLDNPFGNDENDFDNLGMAYTAFEDTYLIINDVDGVEWTDILRFKMKGEKDRDILQTSRSWMLNGPSQSL